jgi:hypothetical protein
MKKLQFMDKLKITPKVCSSSVQITSVYQTTVNINIITTYKYIFHWW